MKADVRYANHPEDVKHYTTDELRRHFLIQKVFEDDEILLTYSYNDRIIVGGVKPVYQTLVLEFGKELGVEYFLERREMGIINIGGSGSIILDGEEYHLIPRDGLYVGKGVRDIRFKSDDPNHPAKFYFNSAPAHKKYPTVKIEIEKATPRVVGDYTTLNKRTIYQYINPNVML